MERFRTPCQVALWYVLPAIRGEVARLLVEDYKMSQKEVAALLGLSEAAISYYLHGKRGRRVELGDEFKGKIREIAEGLLKGRGDSWLAERICSLCRAITAHLIRSFIFQTVSFRICYGWVHHGLPRASYGSRAPLTHPTGVMSMEL